MNVHTQEHRDHGFAIGLLTGTVAAAGLMRWLDPRTASELRQRMTDSARSLRKRAFQHYQQASTRIGEAIARLTQNGEAVHDDVAQRYADGRQGRSRH
jgi:DNA-binding GntR family transcriptional regulator